MKRLSVLAVTAVMAFALSACGENAEKKMETEGTPMETSATVPAETQENAVKTEAPAAAPKAEEAGAKAGAATGAQPAAPQDSGISDSSQKPAE